MSLTLTQPILVIYFLIVLPFFSLSENTTALSNPITIRESTLDYQLRVGERLFVFGKESAGLEKIKVGMRLLDFYQFSVPTDSPQKQTLKWHRTNDGSVIMEKRSGEALLSQWTIFPSGLIQFEKMNAGDQSYNLGFRILDETLSSYGWQGTNPSFSVEAVQVSNGVSKKVLRIERFSHLKLNFEDLSVNVTTLNQPVDAEILPNEDFTRFKDISFKSFPIPNPPTESLVQPSAANPTSGHQFSPSLKLKFEFYQ